jgi:hypothetical protein
VSRLEVAKRVPEGPLRVARQFTGGWSAINEHASRRTPEMYGTPGIVSVTNEHRGLSPMLESR